MSAGQDPDPDHNVPAKPERQKPLDAVTEALGRIRYGVIHLTVHDGKLVQVDVTERKRFS